MEAETKKKIRMCLNKIRGIHKILDSGLQDDVVHFAVTSIEFFIAEIEKILKEENK